MNQEELNKHSEEVEKISPIEIESIDGAVSLKQFTVSDAKELFEMIDSSREHLSQFGDETARKYPTYESVLQSIVNQPNPNRLRFGIHNQGNVLVGSINLTPDENDPHRGEIGYYLGAQATGKGYTVNAVKTLANFAFSNLGYSQLYANVFPENIASIKVLQKAGFIQTGKHDGDIQLTKQK